MALRIGFAIIITIITNDKQNNQTTKINDKDNQTESNHYTNEFYGFLNLRLPMESRL